MAIGEVAEAARSVTQIMHDISAASQEQSSGIAEVNQAVAEMDQATQQNALRVQETAQAALALEQQAELLALSVEAFRLSGHREMLPQREHQQAAGLPSMTAQPGNATPPAPVKKRPMASVEEWETF